MFSLVSDSPHAPSSILGGHDIHRVLSRIHRNLNLNIFTEAAMASYAAYLEVTSSYPTNGKGIIFYQHMVGNTRNRLQEHKWTQIDTKNFPLIQAPDSNNAIAFRTGNTDTGNPNATPQNKNANEGKILPEIVETNKNLLLNLEGGTKVWFLLFCIKNNSIHMELSLPIRMESNKITEWGDRIIFPILNPYEPTPTTKQSYSQSNNDVVVTRKKKAA